MNMDGARSPFQVYLADRPVMALPKPPRLPTVSFVIATHNRGSILIDCLRRTLNCGLPASQFNMVVVDNASADGSADLVESLAHEHPENLRLIRLATNCGPVAKNMGLHKNPADILVVLDDDAYPLPGSVMQAIRHFQDDPRLGAAVFDVTLPDGSKEASAYPDVFIGAGTAFRREALAQAAEGPARRRPGGGLLPADFFMQAEEYDLSFRLLTDGWSVQRFEDMPLMHLKAPGARIGERTTRLDVRNNLWLLARYVPEPLCHQLAADWLARYFRMAVCRDLSKTARAFTHKQAFIQGAAEGLLSWRKQRADGSLLLGAETMERIFKFRAIRERLGRLMERSGCRRIAFGDWGKNILAYWEAARQLNLEVVAVVDGNLASPGSPQSGPSTDLTYRGVPVVNDSIFRERFQSRTDALIVTAMSPVHAARRLGALQRLFTNSEIPITDLLSPSGGRTRTAEPAVVR
jgi:GT2 family glycosyltransferase